MNGQKPTMPKGSFAQTFKAVAWSFLGVRKHSGFQEDIGSLNPFHIIAVGIIGVLVLVVSLIALVNWIVA